MEWDLQAEVGLHHVPHLLCHVVVEVGTLQGNLALLAQLQGADRTWAQLLTALGQEPLWNLAWQLRQPQEACSGSRLPSESPPSSRQLVSSPPHRHPNLEGLQDSHTVEGLTGSVRRCLPTIAVPSRGRCLQNPADVIPSDF